MYAYYLTKGRDLKELISMSYTEKLFYIAAMMIEKEEKVEFYNSFFGGGE